MLFKIQNNVIINDIVNETFLNLVKLICNDKYFSTRHLLCDIKCNRNWIPWKELYTSTKSIWFGRLKGVVKDQARHTCVTRTWFRICVLLYKGNLTEHFIFISQTFTNSITLIKRYKVCMTKVWYNISWLTSGTRVIKRHDNNITITYTIYTATNLLTVLPNIPFFCW